MDASKAEKTRYNGTVAIWYGSHFEDTASHDWEPIKEWNGPYHPLLGEYKTDDRKIIRQHLRWLRRAGVDVIVYDTCRIQPELTLLDLPKQKTLQLLAEELSHQEKETRKLKLVVWMEKWNSNPTAEQYRFGLDYVRKNLADRDFYYRLDGKPLVMTYLNGPAPALDKIDRENEQFFTLRRVSPNAETPGWKYFGPLGDKECMTVNPGANGFMEEAFITKYVNKQPVDDNALRERGKAAIEQRADGKYFENQLLQGATGQSESDLHLRLERLGVVPADRAGERIRVQIRGYGRPTPRPRNRDAPLPPTPISEALPKSVARYSPGELHNREKSGGQAFLPLLFSPTRPDKNAWPPETRNLAVLLRDSLACSSLPPCESPKLFDRSKEKAA